ncbi:hypothetical protein [Neobacillus cucumis]|uniref:hypothetical protein n=1 Tax=Neobacillus cucumis TaxID=1740721 RepID=UPI0028532388|nr:hypothetical protein [Neobacillus cucumis]MDR4948078.1 hypothetical protein [Neobacillus cucumis]
MNKTVTELLISMGVAVNEEESIILESRCEELQQLKKDLDQFIPNPADIALRNVGMKVK